MSQYYSCGHNASILQTGVVHSLVISHHIGVGDEPNFAHLIALKRATLGRKRNCPGCARRLLTVSIYLSAQGPCSAL